MTRMQIIEELKRLPPTERIAVVEAALHLIGQELQQSGQASTRDERKAQLALAAQTLLSDYSNNEEMTSFLALDSEDFHAQG